MRTTTQRGAAYGQKRAQELMAQEPDAQHVGGGGTQTSFEFHGLEKAGPFVKWPGGKRGLISQLERFFPTEFDRYVEPFVGGGAVFFHLKKQRPAMEAALFDTNEALLDTYRVVRDRPRELMQRLDEHRRRYLERPRPYFEDVRDAHNAHRAGAHDPLERAAEVIFLSKTCFNGLWRVNSSGAFNTPFGKHAKPAFYDAARLMATHRALQGVVIERRDFSESMPTLRAGDFAYIDPPYVPVSKTANFTSYTKAGFGPEQQRELARLFAAAARRGAKLVLSNADDPSVHELYDGFSIATIHARRAINSVGSKRGPVREAVVCNEPLHA